MIYDLLSSVYDRVNESLDYRLWADFIERCIKDNMSEKPTLALGLCYQVKG